MPGSTNAIPRLLTRGFRRRALIAEPSSPGSARSLHTESLSAGAPIATLRAVGRPLDEHADDLESIDHEDADEETADYPITGDELDDAGDTASEEPEESWDDDPAEL